MSSGFRVSIPLKGGQVKVVVPPVPEILISLTVRAVGVVYRCGVVPQWYDACSDLWELYFMLCFI